MNTTLLIADRDRDLRRALSAALTSDGFVVVGASTEARVRTLVTDADPDLIVLGDLSATNACGFVEQLRRGQITGQPDVKPVLVLAADADDLDAIRCLNAGADDFCTKPISAAELSARARAILRRTFGIAALGVQALHVNPATGEASYAGVPLGLSRIEFKLLVALAANPRRVRHTDELLRTVWGYKLPAKTRTVAQHTTRLRRKLAAAGATGLVVNVRGIGYRLIADDEDGSPDAAA